MWNVDAHLSSIGAIAGSTVAIRCLSCPLLCWAASMRDDFSMVILQTSQFGEAEAQQSSIQIQRHLRLLHMLAPVVAAGSGALHAYGMALRKRHGGEAAAKAKAYWTEPGWWLGLLMDLLGGRAWQVLAPGPGRAWPRCVELGHPNLWVLGFAAKANGFTRLLDRKVRVIPGLSMFIMVDKSFYHGLSMFTPISLLSIILFEFLLEFPSSRLSD